MDLASSAMLPERLMLIPGRHFASAEILTFIAAFISIADVQVMSDTIIADKQRQGLGVLQPKGKMMVRMAKRA